MLWTIAAIAIFIIAIVMMVTAIQDQRKKGKGRISSFFIGCFAGGFFGALLYGVLGIMAIMMS